MTKEEIKDLVAKKISGQGTMVDVGGALPTIINEIVDLLPDAPVPTPEQIREACGIVSFDPSKLSTEEFANLADSIGVFVPESVSQNYYGVFKPIGPMGSNDWLAYENLGARVEQSYEESGGTDFDYSQLEVLFIGLRGFSDDLASFSSYQGIFIWAEPEEGGLCGYFEAEA